MSTKDIPDILVCKAYAEYHRNRKPNFWPYDILTLWTGQPEKVCIRAMERCCKHGHIEYGVSLRTGWLTESGIKLLEE